MVRFGYSFFFFFVVMWCITRGAPCLLIYIVRFLLLSLLPSHSLPHYASTLEHPIVASHHLSLPRYTNTLDEPHRCVTSSIPSTPFLFVLSALVHVDGPTFLPFLASASSSILSFSPSLSVSHSVYSACIGFMCGYSSQYDMM